MLVKEKTFTTPDEMKEYLIKAKARSQVIGVNVAPLIEIIVIEDKSFCSTSYKVLIGYEYHDRGLEKLLKLRRAYDYQKS